MSENYDIAPGSAGVIVTGTTHRACQELTTKGIGGVKTTKSLMFAPAFTAGFAGVQLALGLADLRHWPNDPALPRPDPQVFENAVKVLAKSGEAAALDALGIQPLDHLDKTKGVLGWTPKGADPDSGDVLKNFKVIVVDEAGMLREGELEVLRDAADLVILIGDYARQLPPVTVEEDLEFADPKTLRSALAPSVLQDVGAETLELTENMRSLNSISRVPDLIFKPKPDGSFRKLDEVVAELRTDAFPEVEFVRNIPAHIIRDGAPIVCWMNLTRYAINYGAHGVVCPDEDTAADLNGMLLPGHTIVVGAVSDRIKSVAGDSAIQMGSRWMVERTYPDRRVDLIHLGDDQGRLSNVSVRAAEFVDKYHDKWVAGRGFRYPTLGALHYGTDLKGRLGFAITTHKAQGSSVDEVCVFLPDYKVCERMGKTDPEDGVPLWRKLFSTAVGRARFKAYIVVSEFPSITEGGK